MFHLQQKNDKTKSYSSQGLGGDILRCSLEFWQLCNLLSLLSEDLKILQVVLSLLSRFLQVLQVVNFWFRGLCKICTLCKLLSLLSCFLQNLHVVRFAFLFFANSASDSISGFLQLFPFLYSLTFAFLLLLLILLFYKSLFLFSILLNC